jgi:hypothetical protein
MPKPIPNCIRYGLNTGWIAIDGNQLSLGGADTYASEGKFIDITGNQAEAASVLLALGQFLLTQIGDPEVSKSVLLEAGLSEGSSKESSLESRPLNLSTQVKLSLESELSATSKGLRQEVRQTLLTAGIPAEEVEFFGTVTPYVRILNETRNPAKTAQTFRSKESYPERFNSWLQRRQKAIPALKAEAIPDKTDSDSGSGLVGQLCDDCGEFDSNCKCELPKSRAFEIED